MTEAKIASLADRGAVSIAGKDAGKLLQGLVTNDLDGLEPPAADAPFVAVARFAGLLSPQGKILFDFFCVRTPNGLLLEVARDKTLDLAKRLAMYKLRADVAIYDVSQDYHVLALWGADAVSSGPTEGTFLYHDPRHGDLGSRILAPKTFATDIASATNGATTNVSSYHAHRVALGVPEGGKDYDFADAYPHEADFDVFNGVSFTKGCYVGQEIVARMQHKTTVRKRVVPVIAEAELPGNRPLVMAGDLEIGRLGSVSGTRGLALLRLDRAAEAAAHGHKLKAHGIPLRIDPPAWLTLPQTAAKA